MIHIKIYQFEVFITVTRVKSFSKAAKLLYLSQPAISKHIQSMEDYYGTKLFQRSNQGVKLTSRGEIVYQYAKKILNLHSELELEIDNSLNLKDLSLKIGASITPGDYLIPCAIWTFKDKHPKVNIDLKVDNSQNITDKVSKGEVDIGFIEDSIPKGLDLTSKKIMTDSLCFITSSYKNYQKEISISKLKRLPLILLNDDFNIRRKFNEFLEDNNLKIGDLNIKAEMGSITAIKSAVEANLGISLLSYSAVKKELHQGEIELLNLKEEYLENLEIDLNLIYKKKIENPNIINKFITYLTIQNESIFCK
ncbi:LysR family transcriptional regulator [Halonatronum saccharophilum]|uniref:LysR family transcriptional regulator n=1 Tax=Halonatronum saccharophilum TaxID=150060 RepID=UPI0004B0981C|nr:LysR family transcriptional regulator [Halonatronum saccharophilum]